MVVDSHNDATRSHCELKKDRKNLTARYKSSVRSRALSSSNSGQRVPKSPAPPLSPAWTMLTPVSQSFSRATSPPLLPYAIIRPRGGPQGLRTRTTSARQNTRRPPTVEGFSPPEQAWTAPIPAPTARLRPRPEAGSRLGIRPTRLSRGCLRDPSVARTCLPGTTGHWSSNPRTHDPSHLSFCSIFQFLVLMHYFLFLCKI